MDGRTASCISAFTATNRALPTEPDLFDFWARASDCSPTKFAPQSPIALRDQLRDGARLRVLKGQLRGTGGGGGFLTSPVPHTMSRTETSMRTPRRDSRPHSVQDETPCPPEVSTSDRLFMGHSKLAMRRQQRTNSFAPPASTPGIPTLDHLISTTFEREGNTIWSRFDIQTPLSAAKQDPKANRVPTTPANSTLSYQETVVTSPVSSEQPAQNVPFNTPVDGPTGGDMMPFSFADLYNFGLVQGGVLDLDALKGLNELDSELDGPWANHYPCDNETIDRTAFPVRTPTLESCFSSSTSSLVSDCSVPNSPAPSPNDLVPPLSYTDYTPLSSPLLTHQSPPDVPTHCHHPQGPSVWQPGDNLYHPPSASSPVIPYRTRKRRRSLENNCRGQDDGGEYIPGMVSPVRSGKRRAVIPEDRLGLGPKPTKAGMPPPDQANDPHLRVREGVPLDGSSHRTDDRTTLPPAVINNNEVSGEPDVRKTIIRALYSTSVDTQPNTRGRPAKRYLCLFKGCERTFPRRNAIEHHIQTHLEDKPFVCHW
jgi:hypothetical protein